MEQTSPEQLALASATKRRCSSNTIDVCAEGARSSASSEVSFFMFDGVGRSRSCVSAWRSIDQASGGAQAGGPKGLALFRIAQKSIDELASSFSPINPPPLRSTFHASLPANLALLPPDAEMRTLSSDRGCRRRIGSKERGGTRGVSIESPPQREESKRAKKAKRKKERPNLVFPPSSFFAVVAALVRWVSSPGGDRLASSRSSLFPSASRAEVFVSGHLTGVK